LGGFGELEPVGSSGFLFSKGLGVFPGNSGFLQAVKELLLGGSRFTTEEGGWLSAVLF
tara:strand:- start:27390 stop:27563 length:174 start_codon:yes stop_codon:yes gene_type:complete